MLRGINASTLILLQYSIPYICRLFGDGPSVTNYELRKMQTLTNYYCSICQRLAVQNKATFPESRDLSCVKNPYLLDLDITCLFRV